MTAIPGVRLTARLAEGGREHTARTDDHGAFLLTGLPPGTYALRLEMPGFIMARRERIEVKGGETVDLARVCLELGLIGYGEERIPRTRMQPIAAGETRLEGWVRTADCPPVAARITLEPLDGKARGRTAQTEANGSFTVRGIAPGRYRLRVSQTGYSEFLLDEVELQSGHATVIDETLRLPRCPAGNACTPVRTVWVGP
jgi:hypothetical protein